MIGIRELSRRLELSIGTVSRALNNRVDVNPETRQRVREAAAKFGYSPNQAGRSLRRGKTDVVGMLVPSSSDDTLINKVFLSVLDGLKRGLAAQGLDLAIFLEGEKTGRLDALRRLTQRGIVDAIVIADTHGVDPRVDYLAKLGKPFVTFGRTEAAARHAWVDPDFEAAIAGAIDHLVARGHRRIGLTLPDLATQYLDIVEKGYWRALAARGLPRDPQWGQRRARGEQGGREAAEALIGANPRPSAMIVADSVQAVALYRRLAEAGLRPGRNVSVIGLLPEARAEYLIPRLTTYLTDWTEIGCRLADAVVAEIALAAAGQAPGEAATRATARVQHRMPVEFSDGESVHDVSGED